LASSGPASRVAAAPGTEPGAAVFRRVVLKLSGEALMGDLAYGIDPERIAAIAQQVRDITARGVEIGIVVGAGNIFRGVSGTAQGMDRATADYMGMIATVLNALAIQDALEKLDLATRIQSAITMQEVAEPYIRRRAIRHLEKKRVVIFAGGTGNPFFTTDTTAALRALEIGAECILMAKNRVEGVLDADPRVDPAARLIPRISHMEAIERGLKVMDTTALTLCMDNGLPIFVFNMQDPSNVGRIIAGDRVGTMVVTEPGGEP
jgi:uridylate kinase